MRRTVIVGAALMLALPGVVAAQSAAPTLPPVASEVCVTLAVSGNTIVTLGNVEQVLADGEATVTRLSYGSCAVAAVVRRGAG